MRQPTKTYYAENPVQIYTHHYALPYDNYNLPFEVLVYPRGAYSDICIKSAFGTYRWTTISEKRQPQSMRDVLHYLALSPDNNDLAQTFGFRPQDALNILSLAVFDNRLHQYHISPMAYYAQDTLQQLVVSLKQEKAPCHGLLRTLKDQPEPDELVEIVNKTSAVFAATLRHINHAIASLADAMQRAEASHTMYEKHPSAKQDITCIDTFSHSLCALKNIILRSMKELQHENYDNKETYAILSLISLERIVKVFQKQVVRIADEANRIAAMCEPAPDAHRSTAKELRKHTM